MIKFAKSTKTYWDSRRKIKYSNFFLYLCMSICQNSGWPRFAIHEKK